MDYSILNKNIKKKTKLGIIGASRGFGYTLLVQLSDVDCIDLRVINSRNSRECYKVLEEIGYDMSNVTVCQTKSEVLKAPEDAIIIVEDYLNVLECGVDSIVETTGNTKVSSEIAVKALNRGINVYMVSKETDSICGPYLNQLAIENNAIYTLVNGDQPRNLIDLYSWAQLLGLEVIALGKSSEYDFVWNRENGEITYTDGSNKYQNMSDMIEYWSYKGEETLEGRKNLLKEYIEVIPADLCEMNLVSNATGFIPASPFLSYPVARTSELAEIFIPREDGGILEKTGVVDVFYQLRESNEASFAGGVFIIVRCKNKKMWTTLADKGHIVSRNKDYACIYLPYHFMGLETPVSIALGDYMGIGTNADSKHISIMSGIASENLKEGTVLTVSGHHHEIKGLTPQLLEAKYSDNIAPFYLLDNCKLLNDVKIGDPIRIQDVDLSEVYAYSLYKEGMKL